jgi:hypothetical protein
MKKLIKRIVSTTATLVVAGTSLVILGGSVKAIPWSSTTTGLDHPGFNVFTGVPGVGDESDFLRGRVSGSSADFTDPVNDACVDGTQYSVRAYVHNAANQTLNDNGTGPGVAHDTKVKVSVPTTTASKITGTISASNAASVTDTLTINCNGKTMQLSYVNGTAIEQRMDGTTAPLNDSIVSTGALIGSHDVNGDMWGCFEQRVLVFLKVQVKEVPTPSTGECKVADLQTFDNRRVKVTVTGAVSNAQIVGYEIDFGDGTKVNQQTAEHTYAKDGTFTITTRVQVKFADGHTEWKTAEACTKQITFKTNQPPELVNTGPGDVLGIFAATTIAGAIAHRLFWVRRFTR